MSKTIQNIKQELKALAATIKTTRPEFKDAQRSGESLWKLDQTIKSSIYNFRHKHIAYCLLRGRTRDQIEQPTEENLPNEEYLTTLLDAYRADLHKERMEMEEVAA